MKAKHLIGVFAFLALACSVDTHTVNLTGTPVLDATCTASGNVFLERGFADVSVTDSYVLGVSYANTASQSTTQVNGQDFQTSNNNFFGQQVVFDYTSDPAATWAEETEQRTFTMPQSSGTSNSFITLNLLQPKALAQLRGMSIPADGGITLNVTFQVKGNWENGGSDETNKFTFPITVVNSKLDCAGAPVVGPIVCGNLQDGPASCGDGGA